MIKTLSTKLKSYFKPKAHTFKPWQINLMLKPKPKQVSIKELWRAYKERRICL